GALDWVQQSALTEDGVTWCSRLCTFSKRGSRMPTWLFRGLAAVLVLVTGCAPAAQMPAATSAPKPATTSAPVAPTQAAPAAPTAADAEWGELTRLAKQEGELVVFLGRPG